MATTATRATIALSLRVGLTNCTSDLPSRPYNLPMSNQTGGQQEPAADALARRGGAGRGAASRWPEAFRELGAVDRAVYEAVARTPTPELDGPVRRLSGAANYSRLCIGTRRVL